MPWSIVLLALALMLIGVVAIGRSDELLASAGGLASRQLVWAGLAVVVMFISTMTGYRKLWQWSYVIFLVAIVLLAVVYFFPPINGVRRWVRLGPLGFQPSEFAKLAFVAALARYLACAENYRRLRGLLIPLAIALVPVLLILKEPDLGTALVFLPVLLVMLLAAGARLFDLSVVALIGLLLVPVLWSQMSREQRSRVTALFNQSTPGEKPSDDGYQVHQSKQMLALGGVWGSWLQGQAVEDPAAYHLPASATDFVFSMIGERFGKVGATVTLVLFALLVSRALAVGAATQEPFGRLLVVGLASLLGVQVLINIAMTVGLTPVTGLSLPLVSYGGSGMLTQGLALGLILNVGIRPGYEMTGEPFRFSHRAKRRRMTTV